MTSVVALIPCRSKSKRIKDKNIKLLNGHPLMAYTIRVALDSKIFKDVIVSTDSTKYADIAKDYGAEVVMRPPEFATDISPDIEWVEYTLKSLDGYDCFSILRPTNPFRTAKTIKRAWKEFLSEDIDSLRAVEKCSQHPYKMWVINTYKSGAISLPSVYIKRERIIPLFNPLMHSQPYQTLPEIYIQNASLEIAWTHVISAGHTIAGNAVKPFFTKGYEGFDINRPIDWEMAELLLSTGKVKLPEI